MYSVNTTYALMGFFSEKKKKSFLKYRNYRITTTNFLASLL